MDVNACRVDLDYLAEARHASIRPLPGELKLTRDHPGNWGLLLRGPKRRISAADMRAMGAAPGAPDFTE